MEQATTLPTELMCALSSSSVSVHERFPQNTLRSSPAGAFASAPKRASPRATQHDPPRPPRPEPRGSGAASMAPPSCSGAPFVAIGERCGGDKVLRRVYFSCRTLLASLGRGQVSACRYRGRLVRGRAAARGRGPGRWHGGCAARPRGLAAAPRLSTRSRAQSPPQTRCGPAGPETRPHLRSRRPRATPPAWSPNSADQARPWVRAGTIPPRKSTQTALWTSGRCHVR